MCNLLMLNVSFLQRVLPLLFIILFFFASFTFVFAQGEAAGVGLQPALIEETADPGSQQEHTVEVTNLSNARQTYYIFTRDIVSVGPGGEPVFADEDEEKTGFELSEWLTLDVEEIALDPGQKGNINVTIDIPENATPGSHFGAVTISMTPPKLRSSGASVGYQVANLISIRVAGDAFENAQIRSFSTDNYIHSKSDVTFRARVENKGTVLVRPTGPLEVHNMFGKKVATLTFNESRAGVFPFVTREFTVRWEDEGPGFGRYQAILSLIYGEQGRQSTISSTLSFWILPMNIIGPALGVLAVLLALTYIGVRLYIHRTVRTMSGSRRLVRRRRNSGISALLTVAVVMLAVTALFLIILLALFA